jgi:alkylation response protein AidB-like acyl-CoA dehydrogenase
MIPYNAPVEDMWFTLEKLAGFAELSTLPGWEEVTDDLARAVIEEAGKFGSEVLAPLNRDGDLAPSALENGVVRAAEGFGDAYRQFCEGGWNSVPFEEAWGGQDLPWALAFAVGEVWQGANLSFGLCPLLNQGAIEALQAHGADWQKERYLPAMVEGRWTGTMNLTEPQAGSDLSLVKARAEPEGDAWRITGQKIFITWGEHDMAENIVHLVLARTPGAPEGSRGISLFLVPKFIPDADGNPGERNDLRCVSLEHKLGIKASPTAVMSYGDNGGALGWMVGEENRGLACMFTMMNNARLSVGLQGVAIAERAYQQARDYALQRVQGKSATGATGAIIQHAEVRRMLLDARALTDAARAITYFAAAELDRSHRHTDADRRAKAARNVELLTPVVKSWATDVGVRVADIGVQVHGGMGFIEETGAAQHYRDARILPIYEGTNGIQALDLIGRKTARDGGAAMTAFADEIEAELKAIGSAEAGTVLMALSELKAATAMVAGHAADTDWQGAAASAYLELAAMAVGGWMMAKSLAAGTGDARREAAARHFIARFVPKAAMLKEQVGTGPEMLMALPAEAF